LAFLSSKPLIFKKFSIIFLISIRIFSLDPVTIRSSSYLIIFILGEIPKIFFLAGNSCLIIFSNPFKAKLHNKGDIIPPTSKRRGVPSSVLYNLFSNIYPDLSHSFNTCL